MSVASDDHSSTTMEALQLFGERGGSQYGQEAVSQLEHALQAAFFAEKAQASAELIVAALLHDVGHLLHQLPEDAPEQGIDDRHEAVGGRWLKRFFPQAVVEPVQLHVAAKRFLCATETHYLQQLSPPSILSLSLQGGAMSSEEVAAFRSHRTFDSAVALRRWDDAAKVPNLATPSLEHFAKYLDEVSRRLNSKETLCQA